MKIEKYFLFDGAMGTYYAGKNRPYRQSQANLLDYSTIVSIHREYIDSGAMAITTNTFGVEDIKSIKAALSAAKEAARDRDVTVFASIGPINAYEFSDYLPIIDTVIDDGQKNFIFETFPSEEVIVELAEYIKEKVPDSFIITSFAVDQNGYTSYGKYYLNIAERIKIAKSIDAYGLNCVCGPLHIKELSEALDKSDTLSIMPNAGYPSYLNGKTEYSDNPEYFAEKLYEIWKSGVKIIGGCCGTTPRHIKAAKRLLDRDDIHDTESKGVTVNIPIPKTLNPFRDMIYSNKKTVIVEYDPPLNATAEEISSSASIFKRAGADAISVADNPLGRARADSLLVSSRIKRDSGITVIPHITCRDRNAISIRSALMGLNIEGINNILCITGDPVPTCNLKSVKGVYSFNSVSLLNYVESINRELQYGNFFEGAAVNVNANHFHLELERANKKVVSGAKYFITQPCFSERAMNNTILLKEVLKVPVIAGLMPVKSYRNAAFIKSEISGIDIPDEIVEKYRDKTPEECAEISIEITLDIVIKLKNYVDGFHIITPAKGEDTVAEIIKEIKKIC